MNKKTLTPIFLTVIFGLTISYIAYAWSEPSQSMPSSEADPPINTGSDTQTKDGTLKINNGGGSVLVLESGGDIKLFNSNNSGSASLFCDNNDQLSTNGTINAQDGLCIDGDCKSSWEEVGGGDTLNFWSLIDASSGNTTNFFYDDFTGDSASVSSNLSYSSTCQEYTGSASYVNLESMNFPVTDDIDSVAASIDYDVYTVIDECNDSYIGSIWNTSGTYVSENSERLKVNGNSLNCTVSKATSIDLKDYSIIEVYFNLQGDAVYRDWRESLGYGKLNITDGTNTINVLSANASFTGFGGNVINGTEENKKGTAKFIIDWTNKKAIVNLDYHSSRSGDANSWREYLSEQKYIDLSLLSSFKLQIEGTAHNCAGGEKRAEGIAEIYYLRSQNYNPNTSVTVQCSNNGGSAYVDNNNGVCLFQNSDDSLKFKLNGTVASNEVIAIKNIKWQIPK